MLSGNKTYLSVLKAGLLLKEWPQYKSRQFRTEEQGRSFIHNDANQAAFAKPMLCEEIIDRRGPTTVRMGTAASKTRLGWKVVGSNLGAGKVFSPRGISVKCSNVSKFAVYTARSHGRDVEVYSTPISHLRDVTALNKEEMPRKTI